MTHVYIRKSWRAHISESVSTINSSFLQQDLILLQASFDVQDWALVKILLVLFSDLVILNNVCLKQSESYLLHIKLLYFNLSLWKANSLHFHMLGINEEQS